MIVAWSWKKGELTWVNLHVGMCFYPTSPKYPIDHFGVRQHAASAQTLLYLARFCCWTCRQPGEGGSAKSLWPSLLPSPGIGNLTHARQLHKDWVSLALHGGVTMEDLAWSLLGVDLEDTPLPYHKDALCYLPRTLPPREKGRNPKIYGPPWNIERPFAPPHRALPAGPSHLVPTPPSRPPPSHVLPSLDRPLVAVNKSLLWSLHLLLHLLVFMLVPSRRVHLMPLLHHLLLPLYLSLLLPSKTTVLASRLVWLPRALPGLAGRVLWCFGLLTWVTRLNHSYSLRWMFMLIRSWGSNGILHFVKGTACFNGSSTWRSIRFTSFLIKVMATRSIWSRGSLALHDREKSLAMVTVCTDDLKKELQHYTSFRHDDSQLPYVTSVLEHFKAIIVLRMPLDKDFTFPLAPNWNVPPVDDKWARSYYRSLGKGKVNAFLPMLDRLLASSAQWCLVCFDLTFGPFRSMLHIFFELVLTCRLTLSSSLLSCLLRDLLLSNSGSGPCFTVVCLALSFFTSSSWPFLAFFTLGLVVCPSFQAGSRSVASKVTSQRWKNCGPQHQGPALLRALSPLPLFFGVLLFWGFRVGSGSWGGVLVFGMLTQISTSLFYPTSPLTCTVAT